MKTINNRSELKQYVRELIAQGKIDTKVYKWVAVDNDNELWAYIDKPCTGNVLAMWSNSIDNYGCDTSEIVTVTCNMDWEDTLVKLATINEDWYPKLEDLPSDCIVIHKDSAKYVTSKRTKCLIHESLTRTQMCDEPTNAVVRYYYYGVDLTHNHVGDGDIVQINNPDGTLLWKRNTETKMSIKELETKYGITNLVIINDLDDGN